MLPSMLFAAVACLLAVSGSSALDADRHAHMALLASAKAAPERHYAAWLRQHKPQSLLASPNSAEALERDRRFSIWKENLDYALAYNTPERTHWVGLNALADSTHEEYRARYLGYDNSARIKLLQQKQASNAIRSFKYASVDAGALPKAIDWRALNAVTDVKNQAQCGSCWAFSTTGSVEGVNAVFSKELVSLSEQELVDCDLEQDKGCNGGLMDFAYEFIIKNKGIDTESDYPYKAIQEQCHESKRKRRVVTIDSFEDVPQNDESALKKAVAHQPVSVAIEADQKAFQLYIGGVFSDESCGTALDHGVLVVGYGSDASGIPYWIVKNSWGAEWGEQGYIRLAAGVEAKEGLCGIAMAASYPIKTTPNPPAPGPEPGPEPGPDPSPPAPGPVICDPTSQCPEGTTCCCVADFLNFCLQWGCCPILDAVCCEDKQHCCPPQMPVCSTATGHCLAAEGSYAAAQPWLTKTPATRTWQPFVDRLTTRTSTATSKIRNDKGSGKPADHLVVA